MAAPATLKPWELRMLKDTIEEHMGLLWTYPPHIKTMLLSQHLRFNDRFALTCFVLQNGLPPQLYVEWLLARCMLKDKAARLHVASILKDHCEGKLEESGKTAYMMNATDRAGEALPVADRNMPVATPHFAKDWQFAYYWNVPIAMLKDDKYSVESIRAKYRLSGV